MDKKINHDAAIAGAKDVLSPVASASAATSISGANDVACAPSNKIETAILPTSDDLINIQVSREMFLTRVFRNRDELVLAAKKVDLSIARSQKFRKRVSFYPKSMEKVGNTVCTFSAPKKTGDNLWSRTGQLGEILEKWNAVTNSEALKKLTPRSLSLSIPMLLEVGRAATKSGAPTLLNMV